MHQNSLNKSKKQLLSTNYSTIMRPIGCFWRFATYFSSSRAAGTAFSRPILRKTDRLFALAASSRDVFGRSEEGRFTLHGESAYTPRRIGLRSTENRATLHGGSGYAPRSVKPPPIWQDGTHASSPLLSKGRGWGWGCQVERVLWMIDPTPTPSPRRGGERPLSNFAEGQT